jgi:hypothetical protein
MDTLNKFLVFPWESFSSFFMQLGKRKMHLPISPTSLPKLGEAMLKSFIQTYVSYNIVERLVLSSQRYHGLASWFNITIEPDAYHE